MRWAAYRSGATTGADERAGLVTGDEVRGVRHTVLELLRGGDEAMMQAAREAHERPTEVLSVAELIAAGRLLAPVPQPPSVRDFMSFESHVVTALAAIGQTVDPVWYAQPVFYFTNPAAIYGPGAQVPMAPGTAMWDFELEVAAIVGREGSDLDPATAHEHIAGYTILCDWSARDLQGVEMRVGLGPAKGKDTATSLGPYLVTPDELGSARAAHGFDLAMTASVNGVPYSSGSWADLHWSFGEMLAYASRGTRLVPGDVIGSGTVGSGCILELARVHGADRYPWLMPGDEVCLHVDGLGDLTGRVGAGRPPRPLRD
jgi:2-keto-4-pentenoate hydratase/2-oxohepta-3-ene-1,7-dioic acid hydratase in catechol pathway